jgi:hypothetical protein
LYLSVDTTEFGTFSQKEVTQTLEHVFGAKKKRTNTVRQLVFDTSKLNQLGKVYNLSIQVEIAREKEGEGKEESYSKNMVTDMTHVTDIETGKQGSLSTSEPKTKRETLVNEKENTENNDTHLSPNVSQASHVSPFKCYYCEKEGNKFETKIETEYLKHGTKRHFQRPMFPNTTDIEIYGLKPQGREWEV